MDPVKTYESFIATYETRLSQINKRRSLVSLLRLTSFLAMVLTAYRLFYGQSPLLIGLCIGSTILFFLLLRYALQLNDQKKLYETLLFVNRNERDIHGGKENRFDNGNGFLARPQYFNDLDIFGNFSLFHLLNRCTTGHGREKLAALLQQPPLDKSAILKKQAAVGALAPQTELRQMLTVQGLIQEEKEGNLHNLYTWLQSKPVLLQLGWLRILRWILPVYNVVAFFYFLSTDNLGPFLGGFFLSWAIIGRYTRVIQDQHNLVSKKQAILDQYASILRTFNTVHTSDSELLQELQAVSQNAHTAIKQLSRLSGLFDQRLNLVVMVLLNGVLMYDIHCLWSLESWRTKYIHHFDKWVQCVGDIEALNTLATFSFNNPGFHMPEVYTDGLLLEATQAAHPLIAGGERIANNLTLDASHRIMIITGSNMSGKTTFLRTIGINLVLAQCGAPVCATAFRFTPMAILSTIRVNDSLQEHTSYFLAELKRLQHIIQELEKGQPALILTDEILRGTNSDDKTHGSEQFIEKLMHYDCLVMFATHDLALSSMESKHDGLVKNYCFESVIQHGELSFDYQLRTGAAQNKNASFLMEKMGII